MIARLYHFLPINDNFPEVGAQSKCTVMPSIFQITAWTLKLSMNFVNDITTYLKNLYSYQQIKPHVCHFKE